jgi:hypothetical protein
MTIAVDFDGTLHTGEWPSIGEPMPGAVYAMKRLKADGHYLIIWSCREGDAQQAMADWLIEHEIPFDRINDNHPDNIALYGVNSRKISADLYVDDRSIGGLPSWNEIYHIVKGTRSISHVTWTSGAFTFETTTTI